MGRRAGDRFRDACQGTARGRQHRLAWLGFLAVPIMAAGVAACAEYPGIPRGVAGPVAGGAVSAATQAELPRSGQNPTPAGAPASIPAAGPVELVQEEFKFTPEVVTAKAGEIVFVIRNGGRYTHDFRVLGHGVDARSKKNGAGRTMEFRVTLETPGDYEFSCPVSNHADRGMKGVLHVVAP